MKNDFNLNTIYHAFRNWVFSFGYEPAEKTFRSQSSWENNMLFDNIYSDE